MIRPVERKSSTDFSCVIHPPPGESTMPPVALSSLDSANSSERKWSSPCRRNISRTSIPVRFSISRSKSRNCLPSCRAAALPIVVFPTPGSPTRIRCGDNVLPPLSLAQRRDVVVVIPVRLPQRVSTELLEHRLRYNECCHRFGDNSHRRNRRDITSFRDCLCRRAGFHLDRSQRAHQGADRLH